MSDGKRGRKLSSVKDEDGRHVEALIGHVALRSVTVTMLEKTCAMVKEKRDLSNVAMHDLYVKSAYAPALKLKEPKAKSGFRTIAIDGVTAAHLRAWKILQAECLATLGEALAQSEDAPVRCSNIGGLYDPTSSRG